MRLADITKTVNECRGYFYCEFIFPMNYTSGKFYKIRNMLDKMAIVFHEYREKKLQEFLGM